MSEKVLGIGGIFFRAKDRAALALWYRDVLGIDLTPTDETTTPWMAEGGPTVFAPFAEDTEYFGNPDQQVMINFRVRDMAAMVAQLKAAGTRVEIQPDMPPIGKFSHAWDPEGNKFELWEMQG